MLITVFLILCTFWFILAPVLIIIGGVWFIKTIVEDYRDAEVNSFYEQEN